MTNKTKESKLITRLAQILKLIFWGTAAAFLILLFHSLLQAAWNLAWEQHKSLDRPLYFWLYVLVLFLCAVAITCILFLKKLWSSLQLGLLAFSSGLWIVAICVAILLLDFGHFYFAIAPLGVAAALSYSLAAVVAPMTRPGPANKGIIDPDRPVPEDGIDLLDRGAIVNELVNLVIRDTPSVIALEGGYGDGKTSLLNLAVAKLRNLDREQRPIIVKFSPWLPGNSTALIVSLLTSITAEIRKEFLVPGLSQGGRQYARALVGVIPKGESLKEVFSDASQQQRIEALASHIAKMPRRILVILDDLDRMQAKELETIFKILRGSEELSSVTFICSFEESELAAILRTTRKYQDPRKFLEKFFQVRVAVPKIDASQMQELFKSEMARIHTDHIGAEP